MGHLVFIGTLAVMMLLLFIWSFKTLPKEQWQILGTIPRKKAPDGVWSGINFSYYGVFSANAYTLAAMLVFILMASIGVPKSGMVVICFAILSICMPASKLIAGIVEKKRATFTVGGAFFVGILALPWMLHYFQQAFQAYFGFAVQVMEVLSAVSIGYAFGEGIGRLACISFGCCYGKPIDDIHPFLGKLFKNHSFVFYGKTKKIAYAHGYDERKVFPIQAVTAVIFSISTLAGLYLYLHARYSAAFLSTVIMTQGWRCFSEFFRADYRGSGAVSAYQWMAAATIPYGVFLACMFSNETDRIPFLLQGLRALWDPALIIFFQCLWIAAFLYTGRSQITGARLTFHVKMEKI